MFQTKIVEKGETLFTQHGSQLSKVRNGMLLAHFQTYIYSAKTMEQS